MFSWPPDGVCSVQQIELKQSGSCKASLTKVLTKSLVHPSDMMTLTSKQLSCLRMEVVQPEQLLMEVKWGVEGSEPGNFLEFQQIFFRCRRH